MKCDYRQTSAVPFRVHDGTTEILIVTNRSGNRWIVPKGLLEPDLTPWGTAALEAFEEAGVEGRVDETPVGEYTYEKWNGVCRVQVFLLEVQLLLDAWPESGFRQRRWIDVERAEEILDPRIPREILMQAREAIQAKRT